MSSASTATATAADRRRRLLERLEELSLTDGHDAFDDVPWDEHSLDGPDERLRLWPFDPLARTDWYRSLPPERQEAVTRDRWAAMLRIGWEFENILQRGLLAISYRMRNGDDAFRYAHHEIIEESQHTMMFNEMVTRLSPAARGMPRILRFLGERFALPSAMWCPPLFYAFVLGGEIPIDYYQRMALREGGEQHPLAERIMEIHVAEEARHVSFAREEIAAATAALDPVRRGFVIVTFPFILRVMVDMMLQPSEWLLRRHAVPPDAVRQVRDGEQARRLRIGAAERLHGILQRAGLAPRVSRPLWRLAGLTGG